MERTALTLILFTLGLGNSEVGNVDSPEPVRALVQGNNSFALDLYAQLRRGEGNRFLSPFSISSALAMTYAGARGDTALEIARALHFTLAPDQLHPAFHRLITEIVSRDTKASAQSPDIHLFTANALWAQQGEPILGDFQQRIESEYQGGIFPVDFRLATERARQRINDWVEKQTRGKIEKLLKPNQLDKSTVLVLTNAIYFKGFWESQFLKQHTVSDTFHTSASRTVKVDMMNQTGRFRYLDERTFQALELPYRGRAVSMVILLPRAVDGLAQVEAACNEPRLEAWLAKLAAHRVQISLPRFRLTEQIELKNTLSALGMPLAFEAGAADFSGMTGRRDVAISAVVHKAFVEVEETGTEAAAATGVVMKRATAIAQPTKVFRADRPFLFLIRDNRSGSILFLGRLVRP
ncbi:MAG: serpin family protein [Isosphaeraceae bacterium]